MELNNKQTLKTLREFINKALQDMRGHNQIISKGGSEGIQCIGLLGEGIGLSIKVEDGSRRAKHAVAIHLLRQLEWISPTALEELDEIILQKKPGIYIEVEGQLKVP